MTRKLQFFLTALLLMVGVTSAWADDWTLDDESYGRTSNSSEYSWASGWPKPANSTNYQFNCNVNKTGMFVLQKYTVKNLAAVKSLTLKLTSAKDGGGVDALAIWSYGSTNPWPAGGNVAAVAAAVNSIVGVDLNCNTTSESTNTPLVDGGSNKTTVDESYQYATYTISGDNLTTLKNAADGNTFVILITNKTSDIKSNSSSERKLFTSGHATVSYRPTLSVTYDAVGVTYGDGTKANYSTFEAARSAVASAAKDATITVMENQNIISRVEAIAGKTLNIVAGSDDIVLTNTSSNALTFLANASNAGTINVGNSEHRMIIKYSAATTNSVAEVQGNKEAAIINLEKVTFKDITTSSTTGVIKANDTSGSDKITLKDVIFDGCTVSADNMGMVFCNANGLVKLQGNLTLTSCTGNAFYLKGSVKEDTFSPTAALNVYWATTKARGTAVVTNATAANLSKYVLTDTDWTLQNSEGSFVMAVSDAGAVAKVGDVNYESIEAAVTGAAENATIKILKNCTVSSAITFTKNVTIVPNTTGITVKRSTDFGNNIMFSLGTSGKTVTIGDAEKAMTIDGQTTTSSTQLFEITNGTLQLTNFTFSNVYTSHEQGVVCAKSSGVVKLTNVAFDGCQATATNAGVVFNGNDNGVILSGNNTFTNCTGYDMCLERRIKVDETNGVTNTIPIKVYTTKISVGSPVAVTVTKEEIPLFKLMVEGKYLKWRTENQTGNRRDMQVAEDASGSYNLTVSAAGAATLVLPYTTTIPSGAKCYTLSYTSGDNITATEITGTLPAHTPVLVVADANTYTFTKTTAETPSSNDNLLMGLYTTLTVPQTTGDNTNYILQNHSGKVGFYKIGESGHSLNANRAYMSVKHVAGSQNAPAFFNIGFGGITGISDIEMKQNVMEDENAPIYNLNGVRMNSSNLPKGIYVKNGRKFIVK